MPAYPTDCTKCKLKQNRPRVPYACVRCTAEYDGDSKVYFIEALGLKEILGSSVVKIGLSKDPDSRLVEIQAYCPVKLRLLRVYPGTKGLEQTIHYRFEHLRARGEWFRRTPELDEFMQITDGEKE